MREWGSSVRAAGLAALPGLPAHAALTRVARRLSVRGQVHAAQQAHRHLLRGELGSPGEGGHASGVRTAPHPGTCSHVHREQRSLARDAGQQHPPPACGPAGAWPLSLQVAAYEFTTLTCIPGVVRYRGAKIQLLDLPGIIEGAKDGKGRGRQASTGLECSLLCMRWCDCCTSRWQRRLEHLGVQLAGCARRKPLAQHAAGHTLVVRPAHGGQVATHSRRAHALHREHAVQLGLACEQAQGCRHQGRQSDAALPQGWSSPPCSQGPARQGTIGATSAASLPSLWTLTPELVQVISTARTCNLILIVLDCLKPISHKRLIEHELEGAPRPSCVPVPAQASHAAAGKTEHLPAHKLLPGPSLEHAPHA